MHPQRAPASPAVAPPPPPAAVAASAAAAGGAAVAAAPPPPPSPSLPPPPPTSSSSDALSSPHFLPPGVPVVGGVPGRPLPPSSSSPALLPPPAPPAALAAAVASGAGGSAVEFAQHQADLSLQRQYQQLHLHHHHHHQHRHHHLQQQQLQQQHSKYPVSSSLPSTFHPSLLQFEDAQPAQQALLPTWNQQHLQQQSPQLSHLRQPMQNFWKSSSNEQQLTYQGGPFQSLGGGGSGGGSGPSGPQSLPLPPRSYTDIAQQQAFETQGVNQQIQEQFQTQDYLQQALYAAQKKAHANAQQVKSALVSQPINSEDLIRSNLKFQNMRQLQARQGQVPTVAVKEAGGHFLLTDQQMASAHDSRSELRFQQPRSAQSSPSDMRSSSVPLQNQQQLLFNGHSQYIGVPQIRMHQSHSLDHNAGAVLPAHAQYIHPQLLPQLQAHFAAVQKASDIGSTPQKFHPAIVRPQVSLSTSGQDLSLPNRSLVNAHGAAAADGIPASGVIGKASPNMHVGVQLNSNIAHLQHSVPQPDDRGVMSSNRSSNAAASSVPVMSSKPSFAMSASQKTDTGSAMHFTSEQSQLQHLEQPQESPRPMISSHDSPIPNPFVVHQGIHHQQSQAQRFGFTRQQLMVLKSQILAFRRLKRGERMLPQEVLRSIGPPPLALQQYPQVMDPTAIERAPSLNPFEIQMKKGKAGVEKASGLSSACTVSGKVNGNVEETRVNAERKEISSMQQTHMDNEVSGTGTAFMKQEETPITSNVEPNCAPVQSTQSEQSVKDESSLIKDSATPTTPNTPTNVPVVVPNGPEKNILATSHPQKASPVTRRYRGPLFDFPAVGKKVEGTILASSQGNVWGGPISFSYDVRQLLLEEGIRLIDKRRAEKLNALDVWLASGLQKKQFSAEIILKLRIEQRKLRLMELQSRIREEVEQQQQEIMALSERGYRKFVRLCERQRADLARQVLLSQKTTRERQLKSLFQWRKRILEAHWASRDARTTRNRGIAKYHERMLREFSKRRDEDRNKRMDALKNNDVDTYREMLKQQQQQTQMAGDAGERYEVLSSFLTQTEDYLYKLGGKISAVKNQQEREEAAYAAASAARAQGLSEEEVKTAAEKAIEEVDTRNELLNLTPASVSKYYSLAHAVNERIVRQPSMLHAGILRDYQLVGLQWMLSLYNNRLNGILADEMGLGKTVQVMALIAYLMEFKCNNGPHLIIVPNAVIVNWKSELSRWLPSVSCIFYVGGKEQRAKMYTQEVCALKFNVLVTTYEFVMRDRARLSKVEWKYIIIDEAQRMKDRESRLARDLDRFRCLRRLLLTGTPLQNDLQELWSLLNLLLPEVFDNSKSFHDWFSTPFQKDGSSQSQEDDWLETEKKVIVIHRLHQILEPFMLRRRVEDVEGSLPPKVPVVLRCKMSALQAAIYDWIKATGTIRLDPEYEAVRVAGGNGKKQMRAYTPLQNKCMELRKVCNHPFLNYPSCGDHFNDFAVRSCGKLWILDRILTKLHRTDHRVLLFSTMTKLLDILEEHLQRRGFKYRRIDGTTSLEMREMAIMDFNRPGSDCFVFLLSIRAAGRGLNLQSADTVVIYDPDPNPKNEEQAVARAHRIGQKREVRVIYMEAVVEAITSYQKEDELRCGGTIDVDDEMAGKDRYMGSVESLVRNTIQQHKIDMADEVINAGRFDQRTSQEERRLTLETLLRDEDRYQERVHDVPTMQEVNRMIARSDEEVELFDQMDEEYDWPGEMLQHQQIHEWLRVGSREVNAAIAAMSRQASKRGAVETFGTREKEERLLQEPYDEFRGKKSNSESGASVERKNWNLVEDTKIEIEKEYEEGEEQEQNLEKNLLSDEEEGEIREDLYEEESEVRSTAEQEEGEISEEEGQGESAQDNEVTRQRKNQDNVLGEVREQGQEVASESSHDEEEDDELGRNEGDVTHTPPASQKFGSLSALDKRPLIQPVVEELEEGEIAASGSSPFDVQVSESWAQDREEGEEQQAIQPRTKRKRSVRHHRRRQLDKLNESTSINLHDRSMQPSGLYQLPQQSSFGHERQAFALHQQYYHQLDRQVYELDDRQAHRFEDEAEGIMQSSHWRSDQWGPPMKRRHLLETILSNRPSEIFTLPQPPQLSQPRTVLKHSKMAGFLEQDEDVNEVVRENTNSKMRTGSSPSCGGGGRMPENTQKKCKNVLQKLQGAVNKDGRQIATLFELPTRNELPGYYRVIANPIDACTIEQHLDRFEYGSVLDFAADVQLMLYNATRYYNSAEVKADARRLQALFFQRMGLKFPDVDFSSVKIRSLATLSQPMTPSGSSPWQQNNQVGLGRSQVETSVVVMDQSTARNVSIAEENIFKVSQKEGKKVVKDSKVRFVEQVVDREKTKIEEALEPEDPDVGIRHPVDFVFRKKKRKDREKGLKKVRMIGAENNNIIAVGNKVSTGGVGVNDGNRGVRGHGVCVKGIRVPAPQKVQQWSSQPGNSKASKMSGSLGAEQWFTPVKKLRTDGGKRRPSHL